MPLCPRSFGMERGGHSGRFQHHRRSKAEQRPGRKKHQ
nr:MAG TPA: hypothetical protein [Caudoviricetes sp.]